MLDILRQLTLNGVVWLYMMMMFGFVFAISFSMSIATVYDIIAIVSGVAFLETMAYMQKNWRKI